jgi:cell division protein FtsW (lipid II flippase)
LSSNVTERIAKIVRVVPRNRNTELFLLLFAFAINAFEIVQVQLSTMQTMNNDFWFYWGALAGAALLLHLVLRLRARDADPLILPIAVALNGLGIAEIYRLDIAAIANKQTELFAEKQVIWTLVALVLAGAVVMYIPSHLVLRRYVFIAGTVGVGLLLAPMLPFIGKTINGASLWLSIGGLTFQPGELAKIALTIFFAGYLVQRKDSLAMTGRTILGIQIPKARELGPILAIWVVSLLVLVVQHDLGTSLLFFGLFLVMIYTATGRAIYTVVGLGMFLTGALVASRAISYVTKRFDAWLNPFDDAHYNAIGGSYQLVQGLFGFAHGGLLGTGLGGGVPQLVPLAESDFIVASLAEELGLAGIFVIFTLYILLVARGLRIGFNHKDDFSKLLATGLSFVIALQVFIVIGGVTRLVPLTGLTTPLLAAGGSSLVANWIIIGLLLRISDTNRKEVE